MEPLRTFTTEWLPIFQAVGAIFSVGGAILSWKYAIKARREREATATNIVAARLLEKLNETLKQVKTIQVECLQPSGDPSPALYQKNQQQIKNIFESYLALAKASAPYLKKQITGWTEMVDSVAAVCSTVTSSNVAVAAKHIALCQSQIETSTTVRQVQQPH